MIYLWSYFGDSLDDGGYVAVMNLELNSLHTLSVFLTISKKTEFGCVNYS